MRTTCWRRREVGFAPPPAGSYTGLLAAFTSRSPETTCNGVGAGIFSSDPSYSRVLNVPFLLAVLPTPLMLMTRRPPSESIAIADGNHAVGNAPMTFQPVADRSTTAIALLPPHA